MLDYFVRQAEASQYDPRLVKTWLDILGAHEFKDGAVVSATWAVLMFDLLGVDVVAECCRRHLCMTADVPITAALNGDDDAAVGAALRA